MELSPQPSPATAMLEGVLEEAGDFDDVTAVSIRLKSGRIAFLPVTIETARALAKHLFEKVRVQVMVIPSEDPKP